jgi:RNA polymerase sigma-70 factor (ECF subfamily)
MVGLKERCSSGGANKVGVSFQTTRWSLIFEAACGRDEAARAALGDLCTSYWAPVHDYVRRRGVPDEEARDVTQAYFAALIDKQFLRDLKPEAGRFRAFLYVSVRNFLSHWREATTAAKRGAGRAPVSLEWLTDGGAVEPAGPDTVEGEFHRRWARTVVDRTLAALERDFEASDPQQRFALLRPHLLGDGPVVAYAEIGARLDVTEGAVKSMVRRLRKRFGALLRAEVARTVDDPDQVDDEIRFLLRVLSEP